jgi:1-phosphofructokinase
MGAVSRGTVVKQGKLLTIAPNPALDRTLDVSHLIVGGVHRATRVSLIAGGKGLNVARAAYTLGGDVLATGPLAGHTGKLVVDLTNAEGLPTDWYWLAEGETRTCLLLNHQTSDATVINESGPVVSKKDWQGLLAHVKRLANQAQAVAFSGSLPPGVDPDAFSRLVRSLATSERTVYLDTSGTTLHAALIQPEGLCIKVNRSELAAGLQLSLDKVGQIIEAGRRLLARGAALVVVTLGGEGALAIAPEGCWQASAPLVEVVSTVGSGDSLLAGLAVARLAGHRIDAALALGVACGAANALTGLPGRFERDTAEALLKQVSLKKLEDT